MHKIIISLIFALKVLMLLSTSGYALDYTDFPENLQWILDDRMKEFAQKEGFCIAGRVFFNDNVTINSNRDVMVNFWDTLDEPMQIYNGGWFIMNRISPSKYAGPDRRIVLRAFGYDPIDTRADIYVGGITYLEFEMTRTPEEKLTALCGTVWDENHQPLNGAQVHLSFPFANFGICNKPLQEMFTEPDGQVYFEGLPVTKYQLTVSAPGYIYHTKTFTPILEETTIQDCNLYPKRNITIQYVYQGGGSRNFTEGEELKSGMIDWSTGQGVVFSKGTLRCCYYDLFLDQKQDICEFRCFYDPPRIYDAGLVDFDSVTEAVTSGYQGKNIPCRVGHVYIVETYKEKHFAKFIVLGEESSFRTVNPAQLVPLEFAGYGLTVTPTYSSETGKLYVRKYYDAPEGLNVGYLPYYWEISGLENASFSLNIIVRYNEKDVKKLELPEDKLALYRFSEQLDRWEIMPTQRDVENDTLKAENINSASTLAIALEQ